MNRKQLRNLIAENLNNLLYSSKYKAFDYIKIIFLIASVIALGLVIYAYGFEPPEEDLIVVFIGLDIIFASFVIMFLIRLLYAFRRLTFLKNNYFEAILMVLIMAYLVSSYLFDQRILENFTERILGFEDYQEVSRLFLVFYLLYILFYEFIKVGTGITRYHLKPSTTFIGSFILLIFIGTGLLMLPAATTQEGSMPFLQALFTSVSASCVTGLIVVDTATYFTPKGQFVIMGLMQLGALSIVSFASFFSIFMKKTAGIKHQSMMKDVLSSESLFNAKDLLKQIIIITFIIEFIGFLMIYVTWGDMQFNSTLHKIFFTMFHTVSAFCNAGFSLYTDGLYEPVLRETYMLHLVIIILVILGGIGFATIQDLFYPSALRDRLKNPWRDWKTATKISVYTSGALLLFGMVSFYLLERNNTLNELNFIEAMITSFFQSGTTRTAGFNTVNIAALTTPTLLIFIFLMFIGGSSGSVAGGIKTSTFYLIVVSVIATIRGKLKIEIGHRYIPKTILFKALSIFVFAATLNFIGIFILVFNEPHIEFMQLAFEQISAFGTVGLSTGITGELSTASTIMLIFSMFLGRVGTLTFALALSTRISTKSYKYPKAHLLVG